jgi:HK97 family phage portal protein
MISMFLPQRRASSTSTSGPLSDFWYGPLSQPTASRQAVTDDTAMTYSACWAATRLLAGTGGWLPLNLHVRKGDSIAIADDPRNLMVHDRPNPRMSAMMFRSQGINQQVNAGNTYAEITRRNGIAAELWPIHYSRVRVVIDDETDELLYEVRSDGGRKDYIPMANMLHVPSMMTDDGISGKGVIRHARESIGMGLATEKYGAAWFGKGGIPRIVVEMPQTWQPDARAAFREEWATVYGGPDASRVALLQGGAKAVPINVTNEDIQFLVTRQHNVEEIARWYGVPPHMIQHLLRATFNNIEHLGIDFVTYSLMPWLKLWEQELWAKLLTEEEQSTMYFEFNTTALLRGDNAARLAFYSGMANIGAMNRNEIRRKENLNPIEGGDTFLVQGGMFAVGDDGVPKDPGSQAAALPSVDDEEGAPPEDAQARHLLTRTLSRLAYKEAQAATRAANKPKQFFEWMSDFYEKHQAQLAEETANETLAADWCKESERQLVEASNVSEKDFGLSVARCVAQWNTTRVAEFLETLE